MSRRIMVAVAWVAATLVSVLVASAAVGSVRNQVSDVPSPLRSATVTQVVAATSPVPSTVEVAAPPSTTSTSPSAPTTSTSTSPPATSTTTLPEASTTTRVPTTTSTPPTTKAPTTTSSPPTTEPPEEILSYSQVGGTTTIRVAGGSVYLVAAVPQPGFQVEVEDSGPREVDVRYRSESHTSKFKAEWENGELEIDTEEDSEDDD